jgi:DNA-directed RNA polymerase subunit RPC12/RpoP
MPVKLQYRCLNCGKRFEAETLTPEEAKRARENREPTGPIHCPDCGKREVRKGWE